MLFLFVAIGLFTFASALYGILTQVQLLAIIRNGRATAVDLAIYLGLDSLDELDQLRQEQPDLLRVVPGPPGTYEHVEFTFSSRRVKALRRLGPMSWIEGLPVRMVSVVLLLAALVLGHERTAGWWVLFAAVAVEAARWIVTRAQRGSRQEAADTAVGEPIYENEEAAPVAAALAPAPPQEEPEQEQFGEPIYEEDDPGAFAEAVGDPDEDAIGIAEPAPILRTFTTIVILRHAWRPAESPIVGGLRRAGQRDAVGASARGGDPERVRIKCSEIIVNVVNHPTRVDTATLEFATSQSWNWPEAASATVGHAAHLTVATSFGPDARLTDIVRLHHRAHLAVSEFAPTIAVLWPSAGKLTPVDDIAGLARADAGLLESCVTFRAFADRDDAGASGQIIDTVGLAGLGRPDLELHTPTSPTEEASAALSDLADRLLHGEHPPADEASMEWPGLGNVAMHRQKSQFEPARDVVRIEPA